MKESFFTFIVCWKCLGRVFCDKQVTWQKLPYRPDFPEYLSILYNYDITTCMNKLNYQWIFSCSDWASDLNSFGI